MMLRDEAWWRIFQKVLKSLLSQLTWQKVAVSTVSSGRARKALSGRTRSVWVWGRVGHPGPCILCFVNCQNLTNLAVEVRKS